MENVVLAVLILACLDSPACDMSDSPCLQNQCKMKAQEYMDRIEVLQKQGEHFKQLEAGVRAPLQKPSQSRAFNTSITIRMYIQNVCQ